MGNQAPTLLRIVRGQGSPSAGRSPRGRSPGRPARCGLRAEERLGQPEATFRVHRQIRSGCLRSRFTEARQEEQRCAGSNWPKQPGSAPLVSRRLVLARIRRLGSSTVLPHLFFFFFFFVSRPDWPGAAGRVASRTSLRRQKHSAMLADTPGGAGDQYDAVSSSTSRWALSRFAGAIANRRSAGSTSSARGSPGRSTPC